MERRHYGRESHRAIRIKKRVDGAVLSRTKNGWRVRGRLSCSVVPTHESRVFCVRNMLFISFRRYFDVNNNTNPCTTFLFTAVSHKPRGEDMFCVGL